jgi:hypothetical protein
VDGGHGPLKFHYNLDCLFNHGVYIAILSSERYNLLISINEMLVQLVNSLTVAYSFAVNLLWRGHTQQCPLQLTINFVNLECPFSLSF